MSGRRFPMTESAFLAQPGPYSTFKQNQPFQEENSSYEGEIRKCWASCATSTALKVGGPTFPGSEGNRLPIAAEAIGTHAPRVRGEQPFGNFILENKNKNKNKNKRDEEGKRKESHAVHSKKNRNQRPSENRNFRHPRAWKKKKILCPLWLIQTKFQSSLN